MISGISLFLAILAGSLSCVGLLGAIEATRRINELRAQIATLTDVLGAMNEHQRTQLKLIQSLNDRQRDLERTSARVH